MKEHNAEAGSVYYSPFEGDCEWPTVHLSIKSPFIVDKIKLKGYVKQKHWLFW